MHHNKTSQHTIIRTYCHPPANLDNHFAIRKHFCKKNKKRLLFTASSPASIPTTGPGAEPLRGGDKSKSHILSISSSQFSTARRAAAPGPVAPSIPARSPLRLRASPREAKVPKHSETSRRATQSRRGLRVSVSASAVSGPQTSSRRVCRRCPESSSAPGGRIRHRPEHSIRQRLPRYHLPNCLTQTENRTKDCPHCHKP